LGYFDTDEAFGWTEGGDLFLPQVYPDNTTGVSENSYGLGTDGIDRVKMMEMRVEMI
jgi:hypothetical protein